MTSRAALLALFVTSCASTAEPTDTPTNSDSGTGSSAPDLQADCTALEAVSLYGETRGLAVFDEKGELEARKADYASLKLSDPAAQKIGSDYTAHFEKAVVNQPKLAAAMAANGPDTQSLMQQQLEAMNPGEPKLAQMRICEAHAEKVGTSKRAKCSALARASYTALRFASFNEEKAKGAVEAARSLATEVGAAPELATQLAADVDAIAKSAAAKKADTSDAAHRKHHDEISRLLAATGGRLEKACGSRF